MSLILAFETSCDDTAVALVADGRRVLASHVASQTEVHSPYGGVIPEFAARQHVAVINGLMTDALDAANVSMGDVDAVAATLGPGLIGSLLVGATAAKTLCLLSGKPFRGVHHLQAHVASNYLGSDLEPPFLCLLVSGGHTLLLAVEAYDRLVCLGETLDDAVGEAYDKVARLMGLPFPGGPALDQLAAQGDPNRFVLPRARTEAPFDFSFSGLKTAAARAWSQASAEAPSDALDTLRADFAASFQARVVDILTSKTLAAAEAHGLTTVTVAGGVSANRGLRASLQSAVADREGWRLYLPDLAVCTDNAAMVAVAAHFCPLTSDWREEVFSRDAGRALVRPLQ